MRMSDGGKGPVLLIGAVLAALTTFIVFSPSLFHEFIELDDLGYIVENRHIETLGWDTVVWAFTQFHEANWHPLTMLSLALDRQLWGGAPFGFHFTNMIIHSCTVFCSCFLFASLLRTVPFGQAANGNTRIPEWVIVVGSISSALFFGLHPLRVESVVWASERKDVLCLFFMTTAIWLYVRQNSGALPIPRHQRWKTGSFWTVPLISCLALLSKPTAVTLPFLLLIIDWYPLGKVADRGSFIRAVTEKLPLFLFSAISAMVTIVAQHEPISLSSELMLSSRLLIACKALVFYLWKMVWPVKLAPFYPHPGNVIETSSGEYLVYAAVFAVICFSAVLLIKRHRAWSALWLYYLVSLAPMLGIIQVGGQWIADRYTYLPALGISLLWGGGVTLLAGRLYMASQVMPAILVILSMVCQIVLYTVLTTRYIPAWRTTESIATRVIDLTPRQVGAAYYARSKYRYDKGDYDGALQDIDQAMSIALRKGKTDRYATLSMHTANILYKLGRYPEALAAADWALQKSIAAPPENLLELRNELAGKIAGKSRHGLPSGSDGRR